MVRLLFRSAEGWSVGARLGAFPRLAGNRAGFERNGGAERSDGTRGGRAHAQNGDASAAGGENESGSCDDGRPACHSRRISLSGGFYQSPDRIADFPDVGGVPGRLHAAKTGFACLHLRGRVSGSDAGSFGLDRGARASGVGNADTVCHTFCLAIPAFLFHCVAVPGGLCEWWNSHAARGRGRWTFDGAPHRGLFTDPDSAQRVAKLFRNGGQNLSGGSANSGLRTFLLWRPPRISQDAPQQPAVKNAGSPCIASDRHLSSVAVCVDDGKRVAAVRLERRYLTRLD